MKDLHPYFQNPFAAPSFGVNKLLAFTTDHLGKLAANNPGGIYDGRIAATRVALEAVQGAFEEDLSKLGSRKSSKGAKRQFRKALPAVIGDIHLALAVKFGLKSPKLATFFPTGRSVFFKCRDDMLGSELDTLIAALTAQGDLAPEILAQAEGLRSDWQVIYEGSESSSAVKAHTEKAKAEARSALQRELFLTLLLLAQNFAEQPEKLDAFMQQSLLK